SRPLALHPPDDPARRRAPPPAPAVEPAPSRGGPSPRRRVAGAGVASRAPDPAPGRRRRRRYPPRRGPLSLELETRLHREAVALGELGDADAQQPHGASRPVGLERQAPGDRQERLLLPERAELGVAAR